jgi:hypothetical protein
MGRVVVTEYVSLDGVFEEPGQWSFPFWSDEASQFKFDTAAITASAHAWLPPRWPRAADSTSHTSSGR